MDHKRFDLDAEMASLKRAPIDAKWSPRKKKFVGAACALLAGGALAGGAYAAWFLSPPGMPRTAQEAVAVLESGRFDRMDASRRRQYAEEAARLLRDMPEDDRRAMFQDEEKREAMRALFEERMADIVRRFARGEEIERFGPPGPRAGGPPPGGQRPDFQNMTDEERAAMRERMRTEMRNRISEQFSSGNAQTGGLQAEMFKRMGGGMGGRGPGGGGGARGGQGGGQSGSGPRGGT